MKLIIDCDPGTGIPGANVDDGIALLFALSRPDFDVRAIWTVFGNTSAAEGAAAARELLGRLGSDVPVRLGSDEPLSGRRAHWRSVLDTPSQDPEVYRLWGAQQPPQRDRTRTPGLDPVPRLAEDLRETGAGVTLACLGPLTNVARLVRQAPAALAGVRAVHVMGGCLGTGELVDTNFAVDPEAARIVLRAGLPVTIVPLDVTRTTELSRVRWRQLRRELAHSPLVAAVAAWLEPWLNYSARTRPVNGMWLHDLVVLAALAEPTIVTREPATVAVSKQPDGKLVRDPRGTRVDLITSVDNDALITLWHDALRGNGATGAPAFSSCAAPGGEQDPGAGNGEGAGIGVAEMDALEQRPGSGAVSRHL